MAKTRKFKTFRWFKHATVTVDLSPLGDLIAEMQPGGAAYRDLMITWAFRWRKFAFTRYNKFSKGGGSWKRLKDHTKKTEKKRGKKAILVDTLSIRNALTPGTKTDRRTPPGGLIRPHPNGVTVGIGGGFRHPSGMSIEAITTIHQLGRGSMPRRKIVVIPDKKTVNMMGKDTVSAISRVKRGKGMS